MPPPPDAASLEQYVEEAAKALGLTLHPEWRPAIAEHYRRLLEAAEVLDNSALAAAEPVTKFEP
jgi:hypothetical protein